MSSGTQYMLQKNPCTRLLAFGILIAFTVITELELGTLCKEVQIRNWRGGEGTQPHCWGMTTDRYARSLLRYCCVTTHITSPLTSLNSLKKNTLLVGKCLRCFQSGHLKIEVDFQVYFQVFLFCFFKGGTTLNFSTFSMHHQYVYNVWERGSKKVQKDWLISKREILWGLGRANCPTY